MNDYKYYFKLTREYLKRYRFMKSALANLDKSIALKQKIMDDVSAPISHYGGELGGGSGEMTSVEAAAANRERLEGEIQQMQTDKENIQNLLEQIDLAIDSLEDEDQKLIIGHYKERKTWETLSAEVYLTEKWARDRANFCIPDIAFTIFGSVALPPNKKIVFPV